jgi:hypothetical protein
MLQYPPSCVRSPELAQAIERLLADPHDRELTEWLSASQATFEVDGNANSPTSGERDGALVGSPFRFRRVDDPADVANV